MQYKVNTVAITGGTHGNELTGVYLVHHYLKNPEAISRPSFECLPLHVNLKAMEQCTRYVDTDLNRCFTCKDLEDTTLTTYEALRAKEINQLLGPKGSDTPKVDFIMDLHTTTSNMGMSLCLSTKDPLTWQAAAYAKEQLPTLNIFYWESNEREPSFISAVPPSGFTIEVGPIPQGVLNPKIYQQTDSIVQTLLDFIELHNADKAPAYSEIEIFDYVTHLDYPRDEEGTLTAMLHPSVQNSGYFKLNKGDPLFMSLEGETITYEGDEALYTVFVNEAAYYEKGVAMQLCRKKVLAL